MPTALAPLLRSPTWRRVTGEDPQPLSPDGADRTVQIRSRAVQVYLFFLRKQVNLAGIGTKKKENSFHAIGIIFNPQSGN
jgi:hypothetical protein